MISEIKYSHLIHDFSLGYQPNKEKIKSYSLSKKTKAIASIKMTM